MRPPLARQPAAPEASTPTLLRVVLRHRGGLGLGVLHHWVNLWSGKKARTQRLIPDALRQPLDDPGDRSPGGVRLSLLSPGLIHPSQCRLDLPLLAWQPGVRGQPGRLAQVT